MHHTDLTKPDKEILQSISFKPKKNSKPYLEYFYLLVAILAFITVIVMAVHQYNNMSR